MPAMEATVRDGQAPAVVVALQAGEQLTSEAGAMMFISGDISMDVEMPGGVMGGLKRKLLAGESLFLSRYHANGAGAVGITGPFPGSIRQHELDGETSRSRARSRRSLAWGSEAAAKASSCNA
jgi:uncharacterized protein (AIM24 family)